MDKLPNSIKYIELSGKYQQPFNNLPSNIISVLCHHNYMDEYTKDISSRALIIYIHEPLSKII